MTEFEDLEAIQREAIFRYEISEAEREAHEMNAEKSGMPESGGVYGVWYGGYGSYAIGDVIQDLEWWESEAAAKEALLDRYANGHWCNQTFAYVNKAHEEVKTPAVGEDCEIHLYYSQPQAADDYYPDAIIALRFDDADEAIPYVEPC